MAPKNKDKKETKTPSKKPASNSKAELKLPPTLDIANADVFYDQIKKTLSKKSKKFIIDGSDVIRITTPCIQILLSAAKTLEEQKKTLSLKNPSKVMEEVFADIGISEKLEEWAKA